MLSYELVRFSQHIIIRAVPDLWLKIFPFYSGAEVICIS